MASFNATDLSYRSEFRELFATYYGRFESQLGQRAAELRGEVAEGLSRLDSRIAQQSAELRGEFGERLARTETRLIRWMFGFWIGSWAALIGTLRALHQLGSAFRP